jgi:hypothetical protein
MEFAIFQVNHYVGFRYKDDKGAILEEGRIQNNSDDFIDSLKAGNVVFLSLFDENKNKLPEDIYLYEIKVSDPSTFLNGPEKINNVDFWYREITTEYKEYFYLVWSEESTQYFLVNATRVYDFPDEEDEEQRKFGEESPLPVDSKLQKLFWRQRDETQMIKEFNDHLVNVQKYVEKTSNQNLLKEIINYINNVKRQLSNFCFTKEGGGVNVPWFVSLLEIYLSGRRNYNIVLYYDENTDKPYSVLVYEFKLDKNGKWFIEVNGLCSDQTERVKVKGLASELIRDIQKIAYFYNLDVFLDAAPNAWGFYKNKLFRPSKTKKLETANKGYQVVKSGWTDFYDSPRRSTRLHKTTTRGPLMTKRDPSMKKTAFQRLNSFNKNKKGGRKTQRRRRTRNRFTQRNRLTKKLFQKRKIQKEKYKKKKYKNSQKLFSKPYMDKQPW